MKLLQLFGLNRANSFLLSPQHVYDGILNNDYVVIDVRNPNEWSKGIVMGSLTISLNDEKFVDKISHLTNRGKTLVISCKFGMRSKMAVKELANAGIDNIYIMKGGFDAWETQALPCDTIKEDVF